MPSRVVAFMEAFDPTGERLPALRVAYNSVMDQTHPVEGIIIAGSFGEEGACQAWPNIEYYEMESCPLGCKRQAALNCALSHGNPTYVLSMGTDDILHPEYVETALHAVRGADWTGTLNWNVIYRGPKGLRRALTTYGYRSDPTGTGRLYSVRFIKERGVELWDITKDRSLDAVNAMIMQREGARFKPNNGIVALLKGAWPQMTPPTVFVGKDKWGGIKTLEDCPLSEWGEWPGVERLAGIITDEAEIIEPLETMIEHQIEAPVKEKPRVESERARRR